ncbi:MAG: bifunctional pyr operon transcriptional regulator/uracil phosphoribosyltransferase PyrR [Microscillaceae bacterium]|nr:bifunctional pyr operon transcriptional regulator/uracil phosphoribosyltransferase PyrR [Microscillaceae bacterium]MDW8460397.1 bifunctional pyr operon transcriptional regulator/uracil phosphoribosyltransferase PyrR [Cytophagales bacterium]
MEKKLLFAEQLLQITINRLCQELIENHQDFAQTAILGLQPRGIYLANRLHKQLENITQNSILKGYLDITFFRDDFRRRDAILKPNATQIDFVIENKNIILIDDVLYTGRSVRAALDAMIAFGRPKKVELLVLIDRKYNRDLPIQPNYVGKQVNTLTSEHVVVELTEQGFSTDSIWLQKYA